MLLQSCVCFSNPPKLVLVNSGKKGGRGGEGRDNYCVHRYYQEARAKRRHRGKRGERAVNSKIAHNLDGRRGKGERGGVKEGT